MFEERDGSVVECSTRDGRVTPPEALRCVLEQDTLSSAVTGSTQEDPSRPQDKSA